MNRSGAAPVDSDNLTWHPAPTPGRRNLRMLPKRLHLLDVVRGLAAFAVVLWHWQHFYYQGAALPDDFERASQPLYVWLWPFYEHGHAAVAFFFSLSGFVFFWLYSERIAEGRCRPWTFSVCRFARLYPLHLAMLLLVAGLQMAYTARVGQAFVYQDNDAFHFALNAFFGSYWGFERGHSFNAPVWSVSIEVGLYAVFYLLSAHGLNSIRACLGMIVSAMVLKELPAVEQWAQPIEAFYAGGLTWHVLRLLAPRRNEQAERALLAGVGLIWAAAAVSPAAADTILDGPKHLRLLLLFPTTIAALVVTELRWPDMGRPLAWIGDLTYSSYLLHFPLQLMLALAIAHGWAPAGVYNTPLGLGTFLVILVAASLGTFYAFERPAQRWLRSRLLTRPEPPQVKASRKPVVRSAA